MKFVKMAKSPVVLVVLGVVFSVVVVYALTVKQLSTAKAQGEIGPTGLGDSPPAGYEVYYQFSGVYNIENDPEFATVVHCTNKGTSNVTVQVQFFDNNAGIPASGLATIGSSDTQSFSTQPIASFSPNLVNANASVDINHGSGWVLAPSNSNIICTAQVLALSSDTAENPISITALDIFQP